MAKFFEFETDFVDSLRCIPMQVRYKLDTCGIKLRLSEWNLMTMGEREALVDLSCSTAAEIQNYRDYLDKLIGEHTGKPATELVIDPHPPWLNLIDIPVSVKEKIQAIGVKLQVQQWIELSPLQRFALIKLSRSGHENHNFFRAMGEFHLL
jgi:hypothetical protein